MICPYCGNPDARWIAGYRGCDGCAPMICGGQGRTSRDIADSGGAVTWCVMLAAVVGLALLFARCAA